jgi:hypothetical protein
VQAASMRSNKIGMINIFHHHILCVKLPISFSLIN